MGTEVENRQKNAHYYKDVSHLAEVDVYRVLELFGVVDPCLQHAIKKLLVPGERGAGKHQADDVREAIYSLERWQQMRKEDELSMVERAPAARGASGSSRFIPEFDAPNYSDSADGVGGD